MKPFIFILNLIWIGFICECNADTIVSLEEMPIGFYSINAEQKSTDSNFFSSFLGHFLYIGDRLTLLNPKSLKSDPKITKQRYAVFSKKGALLQLEDDKTTIQLRKKLNKESEQKILTIGSLYFIEKNRYRFTLVNRHSFILNYIDPADENSILQKISKINYISHRGSTHIPKINPISPYPANTNGSIEDALTQGFDGIEVDLRLALNFNWMISHDNKLNISTDCQGKISERSSVELETCNIIKSSTIPESKFLRFNAPLSQPLWTLKKLLDTYGNDIRLKNLILDVKPSERGLEGHLLSTFLNQYPKETLSKITILVREQKDEETLKKELQQEISIAVEDDSGYDLINTADSKKNSDPKKLENSIKTQGDGGAISLSVGLGLAFGSKEQPIGRIFKTIGNILKLLPGLISHSILDFGKLSWSEKRAIALNKVIAIAKKYELTVITWTVNSKIKLRKLIQMSPEINMVLTDLPYNDIAKVKMSEMEKIEFNENPDIILNGSENDTPPGTLN